MRTFNKSIIAAGGVAAATIAIAVMGGGTANAATAKPSTSAAAVTSTHTVAYHWQGTTNGALNTDLGGQDGYLLWVFNGGKGITSATINLPDGPHQMTPSGNGFKFQSDFFPITSLGGVSVTYAGTASNAVLTISHGHDNTPAVCTAPLASSTSAAGHVTWDYHGQVDGTFDVNASAAGGTIAYTNSTGQSLTGTVTPGTFTVLPDGSAIFAGSIDTGSDDYTVQHEGDDYFVVKVVDGCDGDLVAVFANETPERGGHPTLDSAAGYVMDADSAGSVTGGDLVIH